MGLPLRSIHGGSLCHSSRLCSLIPSFLRIYASQHMNQNPLRSNVRRSKPDILPTTLPWPRRHASSILRLPRRLHPVKYSILNRVSYLPIHYLRSICCQTRSPLSRTDSNRRRVTPRLP